MIVVLPEGLSTTEPVTNVVNGDGTCETLDLTDIENFSLPTDVEAENVVYVREVTEETTTVCLPYDLPVPENATAYTMVGADDGSVSFEEHTGDLEAYQPYLLVVEQPASARRSESSDPTPTTLNLGAENVTISHNAEEGSIQKHHFIFYGTVRSMSHEEAYEKKAYIMQSDYSWRMTADPNLGKLPYLAPFQAYLLYTGEDEMSEVATTLEPATPTEIQSIKAGQATETLSSSWYDLNGRKLTGKPHQKGIYLYQGRLVVIK